MILGEAVHQLKAASSFSRTCAGRLRSNIIVSRMSEGRGAPTDGVSPTDEHDGPRGCRPVLGSRALALFLCA